MPDQEQVAKLKVLVGEEGIERLANATVMVLGVGGVGSNCVEALARGGVGNLILVDHDIVQASNINRQAIAFYSTIGQRKVDVARAMVADINPQARVAVRDQFVLAENLDELLDDTLGQVDYVVDAIDTISTKLSLAQAAQDRGFYLISSMGAANKLHPENLRFADIHQTVNCPLCRIMRKEARLRGIKHLRVLYSCEQAVKVASIPGAARHERSNLGTMSYFPPIMGQMIAGEIIREITGLNNTTGQ